MIPIVMQHDFNRIVGTFDPATQELTFPENMRIPFDWLPGGAYMVTEWYTNPVHPARYVKRAQLMALSVDPDAPPALKVEVR